MKKAVVVVLTVMLALAMCAASLAEVTTPFDDESLNVNVAVKMDEGDISSLFVGTANASDPDGLKSAWIDPYEGVVYLNSTSRGGAWLGFVTDKLTGVTEAEGFGCYVQNNTGVDLPFSIVLSADPACNLNNASYTIGSNKEYALVDMAGNKTVKTAPEKIHPYDTSMVVHSYFEIPAEFEGYIIVPLANLQQVFGDPSTTLPADAVITGFGWMPNDGGTAYNNGDLGLDNIFYYGADVESVDADLIAVDENTATPTPEAEPTSEATDSEPTSEVTAPADDSTQPAQEATPSASDNTSDDEASFPWVIVIIVAVVVIAIIIIAVAASKKKKNSNN